MKRVILSTVVMLNIVFSMTAQDKVKTIYATMVNGGDDNLPVGVYSMPLTTDGFELTPVAIDEAINASHGATIVDGELHFISEATDGTLLYNQYSTATWQPTAAPTTVDDGFITADLLYDEVDRVMYGCFWGKNSTNEDADRESYSLIGKTEKGSFDWELMTEMAAIEDVMALGMNINGVVFAVGTMGGMWHIDQTDGVTVYTMMTPLYNYMIRKDTQYALCFDDEEPYVAYLLCQMRGQDDGTWRDETLLWKLEPQLRQRTLIATLPKGTEFSSLFFLPDNISGITEHTAKQQTIAERYNLNGQRVNSNHRGIVIENGRKVVQR